MKVLYDLARKHLETAGGDQELSDAMVRECDAAFAR